MKCVVYFVEFGFEMVVHYQFYGICHINLLKNVGFGTEIDPINDLC